MTPDVPPVSEPAFWRERYARGEDGWELGRPSPTLAAHLERAAPPPGRVAVLGCGRGHDARLLARKGYRVWGFDFAPEAIAAARARTADEGLEIDFQQRDIFALADPYAGFFDGIWEYTCFCAIDPARRAEYARLVARLLRPGGWLLACFFPLGPPAAAAGAPGRSGPPPAGDRSPSGPPFPVTREEIERLFFPPVQPPFRLQEAYVPAASPPGREDREWLVVARLGLPEATAPASAPR